MAGLRFGPKAAAEIDLDSRAPAGSGVEALLGNLHSLDTFEVEEQPDQVGRRIGRRRRRWSEGFMDVLTERDPFHDHAREVDLHALVWGSIASGTRASNRRRNTLIFFSSGDRRSSGG